MLDKAKNTGMPRRYLRNPNVNGSMWTYPIYKKFLSKRKTFTNTSSGMEMLLFVKGERLAEPPFGKAKLKELFFRKRAIA